MGLAILQLWLMSHPSRTRIKNKNKYQQAMEVDIGTNLGWINVKSTQEHSNSTQIWPSLPAGMGVSCKAYNTSILHTNMPIFQHVPCWFVPNFSISFRFSCDGAQHFIFTKTSWFLSVLLCDTEFNHVGKTLIYISHQVTQWQQ